MNCLDNVKIQELANAIANNWSERDPNIKDKLNRILNGKSSKRVLYELNKSIKSSALKDKNKATLVSVLALLRRNLDCKEEIGCYLNQYGMVNFLYGGLIQFLNGKSGTFKIDIKWNIGAFDNNYEYIFRFPAPEYWTFIDLISAVSILQKNDLDRFEHILLKDKTNLLLLNYINSISRFDPTEKMIKVLLEDVNNTLRRSIGLFLLISPIERVINSDVNSKKKHTAIVSKEIECAHKLLSKLRTPIQAELLVNYFLYNKRNGYLEFLARLMINPLLKEDLIKEIGSTKVRNLEDILILLFVIRNTRVKNSSDINFKCSLYGEITEKIKSFIEKGTGIYTWNVQTEHQFKIICSILPKRNKVNIKRFIQKINQKLMISRLDELVRFEIYLKDIKKSEILSGMDKVITTNLSEY